MDLTRYYGKRYIFEVEVTPCKQRYVFTITAIHRASGRFSVVNNLTTILSAFGIEDGHPFVEEMDWLLKPRQVKRFRKEAAEIFQHQLTLRNIESNLDEDRWTDEWSHAHKFWWIQRFRWWMYELKDKRQNQAKPMRPGVMRKANG